MMTNTELKDGQRAKVVLVGMFGQKVEKTCRYWEKVNGWRKTTRSRRYYPMSVVESYELLPDTKKQTWEGAWRAIANSCRKNNVNLWLADIIEENLRIGQTALQELEAIYHDDYACKAPYKSAEYDAHKANQTARYKAWSEKYGSKQEHPTYHLSMGTQNHWGAHMPKVTAMNLHKDLIERAWVDAFTTGKGYASQNTWKESGRDRSLEVKKNDDGSLRAWYASEYMNCGNGDYYIPISKTRAFYAEKD